MLRCRLREQARGGRLRRSPPGGRFFSRWATYRRWRWDRRRSWRRHGRLERAPELLGDVRRLIETCRDHEVHCALSIRLRRRLLANAVIAIDHAGLLAAALRTRT